MTAQVKALEAPTLKEAENGVLFLGKLKGDAHGGVPPYQQAAAGDVIIMKVETSTGNEWEGRHVLSAAEVGEPVIFAIPKHVFEKKLVPGAEAELHYTVTRNNGNAESSPLLTVQLER
ncbi:hypothetical protein I5P86_19320 [Pseudomonas glycinae]|uniref:hypothetical protein n=1 Tax=Pseudomonas TaxID=286 RepID=UPI0018D69096|nr:MULTISPECIES: hypothetical protein [Pseudomonas]MBH3407206.1 hypothetical protein [Pseudomonas glycinae]MDI3400607.1 hypothetical protein [Pseudomonas sp. V88_4]